MLFVRRARGLARPSVCSNLVIQTTQEYGFFFMVLCRGECRFTTSQPKFLMTSGAEGEGVFL